MSSSTIVQKVGKFSTKYTKTMKDVTKSLELLAELSVTTTDIGNSKNAAQDGKEQNEKSSSQNAQETNQINLSEDLNNDKSQEKDHSLNQTSKCNLM